MFFENKILDVFFRNLFFAFGTRIDLYVKKKFFALFCGKNKVRLALLTSLVLAQGGEGAQFVC